MYCSHCGTEIEASAKFCHSCGHNISETKSAGLQFSNQQALWKFSLLCLVSLGIYEIYWFYKNWKLVKEQKNLKVSPFWRAIFAIFFVHSLIKNIYSLAEEKGYKIKYDPVLLATIFIVLSISWKLPEPIYYICYFAFIPLIPVLNAINHFWKSEQPNLPERKWFSLGETFVLIIGIIFWALVLIGTLMPA